MGKPAAAPSASAGPRCVAAPGACGLSTSVPLGDAKDAPPRDSVGRRLALKGTGRVFCAGAQAGVSTAALPLLLAPYSCGARGQQSPIAYGGA